MQKWRSLPVKKRFRWIVIPLFFILLFLAVAREIFREPVEIKHDALSRIRERGELVALTDKNSLDYFVYRGEPMGYQLDLLSSFADYLGFPLRIITSNDVSRLYYYMDMNIADIIALDLPVTNEGKKLARFSQPFGETRLVVVQRKASGSGKKEHFVKTLEDFSADTIHIQHNLFSLALIKKSLKKARHVILTEESSRNEEELIRMVSEGKISFMVCNENLANVIKRHYRNIDASLVISHFTEYAWGTSLASDSLRQEINNWMSDKKTKKDNRYTYLSYFDNPRVVNYFQSDLFSIKTSKLSPFDDELRDLSTKIYWDWRLLASLVYEESNFQLGLVSSHNARGLMQMMPETARRFGMDSISSTRQQLMAGVRYIHFLDEQLPDEIKNPKERIYFILASYNVGPAKVLAAREKAMKYNRDPNKWHGGVDYYLTRRSKKAPVLDPDSAIDPSWGAAVGFVDEILERYHHYKNIIPEYPPKSN